MTENQKQQKPLREFDYSLIAKKIDGLHFNINRSLEREIANAIANGHVQHERSLSVLLVMLRFAWNSYEAVRYLSADTPPDPARKANYTIVLPAIDRQLLDLFFSLVYMLDDLIPRSLDYQKAGWRDCVEERDERKAQYDGRDEWADFLKSMDSQIDTMVDRFKLTPEEQQNPKLVDYWKTPFKLAKRKGPCQSFLQFLEKELYKDISAQAHLTFAGLIKVSGFLVADLLGDQVPETNRVRAMQSFHFQQVSRTVIIYLAVATEIDTYLKLHNQTTIDYLWVILSEFVVEAKEMYEIRYQDRKRYE
ncbi:hypothetical protein [Terriglobus tenax]|uniref:hypothetical protein n=1 Tax=Terriglobus tenax TaxID=1111115 RepID=UPI0021DF8BC4|nr:hypothetical protein [Terriglobus tenax]